MFSIFKKKKKQKSRPRRTKRATPKMDSMLANLSTKDDVKKIIAEISSSRDTILDEMTKMPESLSSHLVEQITAPLKEAITQELSSNQAVKQLTLDRLSSNQAVPSSKKTLEDAVQEMKDRMENLSQRHLKVLHVLIQNREQWLDYDEIGSYCSPQLTGSCVRGYIADLINTYRIPVEKKGFGRKNKIRVSPQTVKELALTTID